jgi:hypothetical protein
MTVNNTPPSRTTPPSPPKAAQHIKNTKYIKQRLAIKQWGHEATDNQLPKSPSVTGYPVIALTLFGYNAALISVRRNVKCLFKQWRGGGGVT